MHNRIKELAKENFEETLKNRRHLHAHPELSFEEYKTADFVAQQLRKMGLSPQTGIAKTGVMVEIKGTKPGNATIALRADMDALPITEKNDVPYKSKNPGVMHACGHDVHTSSMLGAAKILTRLKDQFGGTIRIIFQPGEEKAPGGASIMIKEGVLENPKPLSIIGQHVMPKIKTGKVGFRQGMYMASADEIYITVKGQGGHGAMPESNIDPVVAASQVIIALQQVVSRRANPRIPSVLSFGKVIAEGATNVIPEEVYIEGTFRTMNEPWRAQAKAIIKEVAEYTAKAYGARAHIEIQDGYPYLYNNEPMAARLQQVAEQYLGKENVEELDLWMAAEDFAYYTHHTDGCFYRLGTGNPTKDTCHSVHTPKFNIDEDALEIGAGLMAALAIEELNFKNQNM